MRNLMISAVVLLCLAQLGSSSLCYTCTMAIDDASCTTVTSCNGSTPFCGTALIDGVIVKFMNKFCSAACITANQNFTIVSATETCCMSDLCNNQKLGDVNSVFTNLDSGASGLTSSAFLMLALGLLSYMFAL